MIFTEILLVLLAAILFVKGLEELDLLSLFCAILCTIAFVVLVINRHQHDEMIVRDVIEYRIDRIDELENDSIISTTYEIHYWK